MDCSQISILEELKPGERFGCETHAKRNAGGGRSKEDENRANQKNKIRRKRYGKDLCNRHASAVLNGWTDGVGWCDQTESKCNPKQEPKEREAAHTVAGSCAMKLFRMSRSSIYTCLIDY